MNKTKISIVALAVLLMLVCPPVGCWDSKEGDVDLEQQRWQYLLLTFPDMRATCEAWQNAALECYRQSHEFDSDFGALLTGFGISVHYASLYVRGRTDLTQTVLGQAAPPLVGIEETYSVTVPFPESDSADCEANRLMCPYTAAQICSVVPDSEIVSRTGDKTNDDSTKICNFQCLKEYWDRQLELDENETNACQKTLLEGYYDALARLTTDTEYAVCFRVCLERGTLLP